MPRLPEVLGKKVSERSDSGMPETGIANGRFRWSLITRNMPFLIGISLIMLLIAVALFGPQFASQNPYLSAQRSAEIVDGEMVLPPFEPSAEFPLGSDAWGRDILSLLLYGARNTLVACVFITMVRLVLGVVLGAFAGWHPNGWIDRLVIGLVEILSSLPILLIGTILIFALDIRRGLVTFLIALSLVGWGEIAQYIRSEFIALRNRPFVEGARIIGLTEGGIVVHHILPNILPQLVVLALLEMGSVLMLLGELGFVGVFIGGGMTTELIDASTSIADIPEWGAILAGARAYVRSAPWMVFYPAMAFFVAVLGANLLGEGLRRIIREAGVNTAALVSKRMIAAVAVIGVLTWYIVNQIGPGVSYAKLASQIDVQEVLTHATSILEPQLDSAGFGSDGALEAAEYIADQFEQYGLLPAASGNQFLQPVDRRVARRIVTPRLEAKALDAQEWIALTHGIDFGEQVYRHGGSGAADGQLVFVGFGRPNLTFAEYRGLSLAGRVVVVLGDNAAYSFDSEALIRGAQAVIYITEDAGPHNDWEPTSPYFMEQPTLPILHVRPEAADRLLAAAGTSVRELKSAVAGFEPGSGDQPWYQVDLGIEIRANVELATPQTITGYNVLGILPGNDTALDEEALMLSTHYDLPEPDPTQVFYDLSDGPAGVGIMIEMARLWQEQSFRPRRTILYAAWCGGYHTESGAATYNRERTPYKALNRVAVIHLCSTSKGENLLITAEDNPMHDLLLRSSQVADVSVQETELLPHPYCLELETDATILMWDGVTGPFAKDAGMNANQDQLAELGEVVNLALITASRQYHY